LDVAHENNILARSAWTQKDLLPINKNYYFENLENTEFLFDRIVNIPSSVTSN